MYKIKSMKYFTHNPNGLLKLNIQLEYNMSDKQIQLNITFEYLGETQGPSN